MASRSHNFSNSNRRLRNVTKTVPVIVGSIALWQGKKADPEHTHKYENITLIYIELDGHVM